MVQYIEFLRGTLHKDTYADKVPTIGDLLDPDRLGLEPEYAWHLYRPVASRVPMPEPPNKPAQPEDGEIAMAEQAPIQGEAELWWQYTAAA